MYYATYKSYIRSKGESLREDDADDKCIYEFPVWFKSQVITILLLYFVNMTNHMLFMRVGLEHPKSEISTKWLTELYGGFDIQVIQYEKYKVNHYKFHTETYDEKKSKPNSNVHVQSDYRVHFFGLLKIYFRFDARLVGVLE